MGNTGYAYNKWGDDNWQTPEGMPEKYVLKHLEIRMMENQESTHRRFDKITYFLYVIIFLQLCHLEYATGLIRAWLNTFDL